MKEVSAWPATGPADLRKLQETVESIGHQVMQLRRQIRELAAQPRTVGDIPLRHPRIVAEERMRQARTRAKFLPADILRDIGWNMLLDLFIHGEDGRKVSVSSACIASGGAPTTALRWLTQLERAGLVVRHADERDQRRVLVTLTPEARQAILSWLSE